MKKERKFYTNFEVQLHKLDLLGRISEVVQWKLLRFLVLLWSANFLFFLS